MYQYDVLMDFFAGSPTVYCDLIIGNNFAKSVGTPCFEGASLWLKLAAPAKAYSIAGHRGKPHRGGLAAGRSVCLYQDSNGAKTWKKCQGYNTERRDYWRYPEGKTASFRGYRVWMRGPDAEGAEVDTAGEQIAAGDQATGTTHVSTDRGEVVVHLLNFWQQFPKGIEAFGDGRVRLADADDGRPVRECVRLADLRRAVAELRRPFVARRPPADERGQLPLPLAPHRHPRLAPEWRRPQSPLPRRASLSHRRRRSVRPRGLERVPPQQPQRGLDAAAVPVGLRG
jgi:hypothetical protein